MTKIDSSRQIHINCSELYIYAHITANVAPLTCDGMLKVENCTPIRCIYFLKCLLCNFAYITDIQVSLLKITGLSTTVNRISLYV
jgi:hypothetical protein